MGWLWHALAIAGSMTWEILWALILGFALSAVVQAVASTQLCPCGQGRKLTLTAHRQAVRRAG